MQRQSYVLGYHDDEEELVVPEQRPAASGFKKLFSKFRGASRNEDGTVGRRHRSTLEDLGSLIEEDETEPQQHSWQRFIQSIQTGNVLELIENISPAYLVKRADDGDLGTGDTVSATAES